MPAWAEGAWAVGAWEDDPPAWEGMDGEDPPDPPGDTDDDSWIVISRRRGRR